MRSAFLIVAVLSLYSTIALSRELYRRPLHARPPVPQPIWSNCSKKDDVASIENVKITPDVIKENQNINVVVKFTLKSEVSDGEISIDLAGVPGFGNLSTVIGVCDALSSLGQACPVKQGPGMFDVTQTIPELGQSANITGTVIGKDGKGTEIFCVKLNVTLHE